MNRSLLQWALSCLLLVLPLSAAAWDEHTHEVIACLATKNLTPKTRKQVERILGGAMADHATWLNTQKRAIKGCDVWHNILLDENNHPIKSGQDGLSKIAEQEKVLRNRKSYSLMEVATALKSLIHIVSDMHCPSHVLFQDIPRSAGFKFATTNNRTDNFAQRGTISWYNFWNDKYSTNRRGFSTEWSAYDLSVYAERNKAEWAKGSPNEWAEEQGRECRPLYAIFTEGRVIGPEVTNSLEDMHNRGAARAALRLATLLNNIFAK